MAVIKKLTCVEYSYNYLFQSILHFLSSLFHFLSRVIILLQKACLYNRIGRNWGKFSWPECATSLETARSLINDPSGAGGGGGGEFPGNCSVSYLSFIYGSTGGVCGRSLTAGKIFFTSRQTCSLYIVLWVCDTNCNLRQGEVY